MQVKIMSILLAASFLLESQLATAKEVVHNFSQAVTHPRKVVGRAFTGTAKTVTGVVTIPFLAIGGVANLSKDAGEKPMDYSNKDPDPLPMTDETIAAGPSPTVVMQIPKNNNDKIDAVLENQKNISKQIQANDPFPLAGRNYGVEFNFFRLINYDNNHTLAGGVSLFNVNRNAEITFPFYFAKTDDDDFLSLNVFALDVHYRNFLGEKQKGFYLSGFARFAHLSGQLKRDIFFYNSTDSGQKGGEDKLGFGVGIGYRIFSKRGWYWGTSFNIGRYVVGENNRFEGVIFEVDYDGELIVDFELLKFGWAF